MGLSNEERYSYFFAHIKAMRDIFQEAKEIFRYSDRNREKSLIVLDSWITTIDDLVGFLITKLNTNTHLWILGSNKDNYQSLFNNHYGLSKQPSSILNTEKQYSLSWYRNEFDIKQFVQVFSGGKDKYEMDFAQEELIKCIAAYWSAYSHIDTILYGAYRYQDDAFGPEFNKRLTNFIGRLANERYDFFRSVCYYYDTSKIEEIEQIILCKYRWFKNKINDIYEEKSQRKSKSNNESQRERYHRKLWKEIDENRFDIAELMREVKETPLFKIEQYLIDYENKVENRTNIDDKSEKKEDKINPIFGPRTLSENELIKIIENPHDCTKAQYENAVKEIWLAYNSMYGCDSWEEQKKLVANRKNKTGFISKKK